MVGPVNAVSIAALLTLGVVGILQASAQTEQTLVQRVGSKEVVALDQAGRRVATVYRSNMLQVSDLTVSSDGRRIALLETSEGLAHRNRLVVVNSVGTVERIVGRDVRTYVWCGPQRVAFITGEWRESSEIGFRPDGAFIVDLTTGVEERVDVPVRSYQVVWAAFDSALYFKRMNAVPGSNIVRYDTRTRRVEQTTYRDFAFSPSGRHYLQYISDPAEGRYGWHIFERTSGHEIPLPDSQLGGVQGWVFSEGDYLKLARVSPILQRGSGLVVRDASTGGELIGFTFFDLNARRPIGQVDVRTATNVVAPQGTLLILQDSVPKVWRTPRDIVR